MSQRAQTTASVAAEAAGAATARSADERHPAQGRREGRAPGRSRLGRAWLCAQLPLSAQARGGGDRSTSRRAPEARYAAGAARGENRRRGADDRGQAGGDGAALRDEG